MGHAVLLQQIISYDDDDDDDDGLNHDRNTSNMISFHHSVNLSQYCLLALHLQKYKSQNDVEVPVRIYH